MAEWTKEPPKNPGHYWVWKEGRLKTALLSEEGWWFVAGGPCHIPDNMKRDGWMWTPIAVLPILPQKESPDVE